MTIDAQSTLAMAFIVMPLGYCNSILPGISAHVTCHFIAATFILPYLTLPSGRTSPVDGIQHSDHQVGPLCFPDKPDARVISQKLRQASGVKANVCYWYSACSKDVEE